jgi:hypothetical protein
MKIVAVVCNVLFWGFFCMVMFTDGTPKGSDIVISIFPLLMPILNVMVLRVLASPGRGLKTATMIGNILWLVLACWVIIDRYPSHPQEEGLIAYVVLMALTPLLSTVAMYWELKAPKPAISN